MYISREKLISYLNFAMENQYALKFINISGTETYSGVLIERFNENRLFGRFTDSNSTMNYQFCNIASCYFPNVNEQQLFDKHYFFSSRSNVNDVKKLIENYEEYYRSIIPVANNNNKTESSDDETEHAENRRLIEYTKDIYKNMFQGLYQKHGLFLNYLLSQRLPENSALDSAPILLLSQSNYSQKQAIEKALQDRVSVIEGPPGTGKTTTILNIIGNLVLRNKRIIVISKNSSAIENIEEELGNLGLPKFYLRLGNRKIIDNLNDNLKETIASTSREMERLSEIQSDDIDLAEKYAQLKRMETELNHLMSQKNQLQEYENQLRHLEKRKLAYKESRPFRSIRLFQRIGSSILRKEIDRIASALQNLDKYGEISVWNRLLNGLLWGMTTEEFVADGTLLQFELEDIYLKNKISKLSSFLDSSGLAEKQNNIEKIYDSCYIKESLNLLKQTLYSNSKTENYRNYIQKVNSNKELPTFYSDQEALNQIYPVFLTTANALIYNFVDMFRKGTKVDYIIMDEASQCDLISGLPMLSLAERCVIVGDQKQLSAIKGKQVPGLPSVDEGHDYFKQTFLSSVKKVWDISPVLLLEHYRCDYSIINYCNKFFYDNSLIIYTKANDDSMILLPVEHGQYSKYTINEDTRRKSFYNKREISSIQYFSNQSLEKAFVITPFSLQGSKLQKAFQCTKDTCGTIHTFQGKGEDTVYFSTVLNDLPPDRSHLSGTNCLFTEELINVAVSRAKKRFVLVTNSSFLRNKNKEIQELINYIETYGKEIADKSVCIFDDLYKQMDSYTSIDRLDNIFEKKLYDLLREYCETRSSLYCRIKLPLASLITDKNFLGANPDIKKFVLHKNTHIDFTIFNAINNPLLAIELDGAYHMEHLQKQRDAKKNLALEHMNIPLWRISSKSAFSKEEFFNKLEKYLSGSNVKPSR